MNLSDLHARSAACEPSLVAKQEPSALLEGKGFDSPRESNMSPSREPALEHLDDIQAAAAPEPADICMQPAAAAAEQSREISVDMDQPPDKEVDALEKCGFFWKDGKCWAHLR